MDLSSMHLPSQTGIARELKFWEKVHLSQPVMCHASPVMCHMSHVTCKKNGQSCGASRWRVCYQWGLPYLVLILFNKTKTYIWFSFSTPSWKGLRWLIGQLLILWGKGGMKKGTSHTLKSYIIYDRKSIYWEMRY